MPRQKPPPGHVLYKLAALIRQRRLARGLTQDDLAQLIDCSLRAVRSYELGFREPPIDQLMRIARACDLPLSLFLAPLDEVIPHERERHQRTAVHRDEAAARHA